MRTLTLACATALCLSVAPVAHADRGLGTTRQCNFEQAPAAGCVSVEKSGKRKLSIQPLRKAVIRYRAKVSKDGEVIEKVVRRGADGFEIPYRDGEYQVRVRMKNASGWSTAVKDFIITDGPKCGCS